MAKDKQLAQNVKEYFDRALDLKDKARTIKNSFLRNGEARKALLDKVNDIAAKRLEN